MFHVVSKLGLNSLDWIEEFDSFPLFSKVGGMRFARGDAMGRASVIRKTIRLMREEKRSLVIFPEGVLHRPPSIEELGRSLEIVARKVPGVAMVPTAIYYEMSIHERPEAWIRLGNPHEFNSLADCRERLTNCLDEVVRSVKEQKEYPILFEGTRDVNERFSLRSSALK
jgi:1-acyl-sn-glycerol-3-phosphate acyltransferase